MPHVEVNETRFYVVRHGRGHPAVVLHGGPGLSHAYMRGLDPLGALAALTYYDQCGAGLTTEVGPPTVRTNERHADDLEALRRALGLDKMVLIGHSHGGSVALEYALKYPKTAAGLLLVSSVGTYSYPMIMPDEYMRRLGPEQRRVLSRPTETDADARRNLRARLLLSTADASRAADVLAAFEDVPYGAGAAKAAGGTNDGWSVIERLGAVETPALVVGGQQDWIAPPREMERLAAALPRAELVLLEDCGHFPWIEQPKAFFDVAQGILSTGRLTPS